MIHVENAGVPTYDELVLVARRERDRQPRPTCCAGSCRRSGAGYEAVRADPQAGSPRWCSANPALSPKLQLASVRATLPSFFPSAPACPGAGRTRRSGTPYGAVDAEPPPDHQRQPRSRTPRPTSCWPARGRRPADDALDPGRERLHAGHAARTYHVRRARRSSHPGPGGDRADARGGGLWQLLADRTRPRRAPPQAEPDRDDPRVRRRPAHPLLCGHRRRHRPHGGDDRAAQRVGAPLPDHRLPGRPAARRRRGDAQLPRAATGTDSSRTR